MAFPSRWRLSRKQHRTNLDKRKRKSQLRNWVRRGSGPGSGAVLFCSSFLLIPVWFGFQSGPLFSRVVRYFCTPWFSISYFSKEYILCVGTFSQKKIPVRPLCAISSTLCECRPTFWFDWRNNSRRAKTEHAVKSVQTANSLGKVCYTQFQGLLKKLCFARKKFVRARETRALVSVSGSIRGRRRMVW